MNTKVTSPTGLASTKITIPTGLTNTKITIPTGLASTKDHYSNRTREHKRSRLQQDSRTQKITIPTGLANNKMDHDSNSTREHKGLRVQKNLRTQSITSPVGLVILCVLCQFVACSILITLTPTTTHIYKSNGFTIFNTRIHSH